MKTNTRIDRLKRFILLLIRKCTNDRNYIKIRFFLQYHRWINLNNPDTFFAKINWLKLNDRKPEYTNLVDKYEVRQTIEEKIGKEYLIDIIDVFEKHDEIDFNKLPESFVLKTSHGSDWIIICRDKKNLDVQLTLKKLKTWLDLNYYDMWGEYAYKDVQPRIICEEYLENEKGKTLIDYKFYCFDGVPKLIHVDQNRFDNHTLDFYDLQWNRLPFGLLFPQSKMNIPRPSTLNRMIEISSILSQGMKFVRIDLYEVHGKVYFGEYTLYPCSGFGKFYPASADYQLGELINL